MQYYKSAIDGVETNDKWWFVINEETLDVITNPNNASGIIATINALVVCDTKEECLAYIGENSLALTEDPFEPYGLPELP